MITTKEQERKALVQIKKIVDGLGADSYIAAAFEGCFEIAEQNINNDFACSMKQNFERARKKASKFEAQAAEYKKQVEKLTAQLEEEQAWMPYEDTNNVSQHDYELLVSQDDTKLLSDDEAKELLYNWYGFAKEKTKIHHSIPKYEVNCHRQLRVVGEIDRRPAYNSTDWNYIRFDCEMMTYELHDGELRFYLH